MRLSHFLTILIFCAFYSTSFSQSSREINKVIPLKSDGHLFIDTYKGSITITTHEKPQVELNVKIESDDTDSRDAERDVEETEIEITDRDNELILRTDYKNIEHHHNHSFWDWIADPSESSYALPLVHYTVKMPRTASLRIKDYKSDSRIEDVKSNVRFYTYKGDVEIEKLDGRIDLETYKSKVRISFIKFAGDSRFETYKGNIRLEIPEKNGFELQTDFGKRVNFITDFDVEAVDRDRKHHSYDYRGKINGGGPSLELSSNKGDIHLKAY
jgi:hypothetical protein